MKSLMMRSGAAALCALALAGCGGSGNGDLILAGAITGLDRTGLTLTNNGGTPLVIADSASSFAFPELIATDKEFFVEVKTQPPGQQCTPSNNRNKANYYTAQQVLITCLTDSYLLGGTISGLTQGELTLANGAATVTLRAGITNFTFPVKVGNRRPYGVTVLTQPAGLTCTVANGSGEMPVADRLNIAVSCTRAA